MQMDDTKQIFTGKAAAYSKRPAWTREYLIDLLSHANVPTNGTIVDLGSGDGKLTKVLLDFFPRSMVYAVEPNADMRTQAENALKGTRGFHSIAGDTLNPNLPEKLKADFITAGQAAHWWSESKTGVEQSDAAVKKSLRQILKAEAPIAYAFYNLRFNDTQTSQVAEEIHGVLSQHLDSYRNSASPLCDAPIFEREVFEGQISDIQTIDGTLPSLQLDIDDYFTYLSSFSFLNAKDILSGTQIRKDLERVFTSNANDNSEVVIPVYTKTYLGSLEA